MALQKHYVQIPKDLREIKQKFILGLTKRQLICFSIGLAMGLPVFWLTKNFLGLSGGIAAMGIIAAPAILCGIYKKNGIFLERQIKNMIKYFKSPRIRTFRNVNNFECIERQLEYNRLKKILQQAEEVKIKNAK